MKASFWLGACAAIIGDARLRRAPDTMNANKLRCRKMSDLQFQTDLISSPVPLLNVVNNPSWKAGRAMRANIEWVRGPSEMAGIAVQFLLRCLSQGGTSFNYP